MLVSAKPKLVACLLASDFPSENPRTQTGNVPYINVLLVEDDFEIGKWLEKRILELSNIKSFNWETSIEKASTALSLVNPDIIILDLNLPDGNGIDLLKKIKSIKNKSKVFIFSVNNELRKTCLRLGADYFFDKTTDSEKLIESLK